MIDYGKVPVSVGSVPMDELTKWAQGSVRFMEVMSEESRFKEAVNTAQKQMKERGIQDRYIEAIGFDEYYETVRKSFLVIYVRAVTERFFQRKTEAEIESETLSNPEWMSNAVEQATEWIVGSTVQSVISSDAIEFVMNLLGDEEDDDDEEDGCNEEEPENPQNEVQE